MEHLRTRWEVESDGEGNRHRLITSEKSSVVVPWSICEFENGLPGDESGYEAAQHVCDLHNASLKEQKTGSSLKGWRRGCDIPADERVGWWQYTGSTEDLPRISFYVVHVSQCGFCSNIWYRPVQFNDEIEPPPIQPLELPEGLRYVGERWKFLWSSLSLWCMSDDFPATTVYGNLCSCSDTPHCLVCHVFDMPPEPDNPLDHIYHRQPDGSWKRWEGQ